MIEFVEVTKSFEADLLKGKRKFLALDNLSFKIKPGKLTGFLGANGAGKTTSLKILFQFINASSGKVVYDEALGKSWGQICSQIGYVPERPYFYPYLLGREFLYFTSALNNISKEQTNARIQEWAERLGIAHALDRQIKGYSKGMLQRIGVLSCLLHNPKLIILDEPLSGLDPLGRTELKKVFTDLQRLGTTVFFSSHIVSDVEEVCDSVVVIEKGQLVYQGVVNEVLDANSANEFLVDIKHDDDFSLSVGDYLSIEKTTRGSQLSISGEVLDRNLSELLKTNCRIERVQRKRITLEEFVYRSRSGGELNAPS